jgi:hypothetical protein
MTTATTSPNPIASFLSAFAADTSTCAMPDCATRIILSESLYIDGCGQVCTACAGPSSQWLDTIEPPF